MHADVKKVQTVLAKRQPNKRFVLEASEVNVRSVLAGLIQSEDFL